MKRFLNTLSPNSNTWLTYLQLLGTIGGTNFGVCVDMAKVGGNSRSVYNIIQGKFSDEGRVLEEQSQGLPNATTCSQNSNFDIVLEK